MSYHVSKAEFAALIQEAIAELPPKFAAALDEVSIELKDRPTRRQLH